MRKFLYSFVVLAVLAGAAFLLYVFYYLEQGRTLFESSAGNSATSSLQGSTLLGSSHIVAPARQAPAGYKTYTSSLYRFSLFYPQELSLKGYDEGGGAQTIIFQNIKTAHGFQIFITPYSEPQVSTKRFKQDEPSGVRNNLTNITLDGATGAAFYSTNNLLGDTREVWVIHGGYLYEITTLKSLDMWLDTILQTWQFLIF